MDRITLEDLQALLQRGIEPKLSLYVHQQPKYPESEENGMHLRHALFEAATRLIELGHSQADVDSLLRPGVELVRGGELNRANGSRSLAVLLSPDTFDYWQLPFKCESSVQVGAEFCITPLVRLSNWPHECRVAALCADHVRYFHCTQDTILELDLPTEVPDGRDNIAPRTDIDTAVRFQSSAGVLNSIKLIHGQASLKDDEDIRLQTYLRAVAQTIGKAAERDNLPLVLIAARELHSLFKDAFPTTAVLLPPIDASPAHLSAAEIHQRVLPVIERYGNAAAQAALQHYQSAQERHYACQQPQVIASAAYEGRIDTLIVAEGEHVWGLWDSHSRHALVYSTHQTPCIDLLEFAVRESLRHRGRVCVMPRQDVPNAVQCCAVMRWVPTVDEASFSQVFRSEL